MLNVFSKAMFYGWKVMVVCAISLYHSRMSCRKAKGEVFGSRDSKCEFAVFCASCRGVETEVLSTKVRK